MGPSQMLNDDEDGNGIDLDSIHFNEEITENANKELKKKIIELQTELETMKRERQRQLEEDDLGILYTGMVSETKGGPNDFIVDDNSEESIGLSDGGYGQTPSGPDPNTVALESSNDKPLEQQPQFIEFKNKMEDQMERLNEERNALEVSNQNVNMQLQEMKQQMDGLNREIKRVSDSKIELLINTSKEIDALRKLLTDYVQLANQQKEKYSGRQ